MSFRRGQLRNFVTVAEEGQITRASAKLRLAQPAVSQSIAQLEFELGVELLERHPRGVTLTPAGEAFLPKARDFVASERDAEMTAKSLARAAAGVIEVGFIGPPPTLSAPELFNAFAEAHPDAEVSLRDLPFPRGATATWLEEVDVAFCHRPAVDPGISLKVIRTEPRGLVAHAGHRFARREELTVAEVLDETFVSYHPDVQPEWAGFHSLDDHRGGPPRSMTVDRAMTSLQMLGIMTTSRAVTTVPLTDARVAQAVLPAAAIPLTDADPAVVSLVWRAEHAHPLVRALVTVADELA